MLKLYIPLALAAVALTIAGLGDGAVFDGEYYQHVRVTCFERRKANLQCRRVLPKNAAVQGAYTMNHCCRKSGARALGGKFFQLQQDSRRTCHACPPSRNGKWSLWQSWGFCSTLCGPNGIRTRHRYCTSPSPLFDGKSCKTAQGDRAFKETETAPCNRRSCPVHGGWSEWSNYGQCSVTCGDGIQISFRTCTNPAPLHGGRLCSGLAERTKPCKAPVACFVLQGAWTDWSDFSPCSSSCGLGSQERHRSCEADQRDKIVCLGPLKEEHYCIGSCGSEIDCSSDGSGSGSGSGSDGSGSGNGGGGLTSCCRRHKMAYNGRGQCCPSNCQEDDEECNLASASGEELSGSGSGSGSAPSGGCRPISGWNSRQKRDLLEDLLPASKKEVHQKIQQVRQHPEHIDEEFQDDDYLVTG